MADKSSKEHWDGRYRDRDTPWESGAPSTELQRVVAEHAIKPCRTIELGCGAGASSIWLAQQGFEVVGVDISELAIERAQQSALQAGVNVHFTAADILNMADMDRKFDFFFDRGCYHVVRRLDPARFVGNVDRWTTAAGAGLVLAGHAGEKMEPGPPVVTEEELRTEWASHFEIVDLQEFRFDQSELGPQRPLAWSAMLRKK